MNVRHLLETNFPTGSTEGCQQHLSVSTEGFRDIVKRLFSSNSVATSQKALKAWVDYHVVGNAPITVTDKDTVELPKSHAVFFKHGGQPVPDVLKAVKTDLGQYKQLAQRYFPLITRNAGEVSRIRKEMTQHMTKDQLDEDAVADFVLGWEKRIAKTAFDEFKEPHRPFLGFGEVPFTTNRRFIGLPGKVKPDAPAQIPVVSQRDAQGLIAVVKELMAMTDRFIGFAEQHSGIDLAETPFHLDDHPKADEVRQRYMHPTFDEENTDLLYNIGTRCEKLAFAIVVYLKHITE
jgi:hypothetical protein